MLGRTVRRILGMTEAADIIAVENPNRCTADPEPKETANAASQEVSNTSLLLGDPTTPAPGIVGALPQGIKELDPSTLPIHPLALLLPEASPQDYTRLFEDLRNNPQQEPVTLLDGACIDGRTRVKVLAELGRKVLAVEWTGTGDPLAFVLSKNVSRRHLTPSQLALAAANYVEFILNNPATRVASSQEENAATANLQLSQLIEQAANIMNCSPRSIAYALKAKKGIPELIQAVQGGTLAISAAAAVADQSPERQAALLAQGSEAIAIAAKTRRTRKQKHRATRQKTEPKSDQLLQVNITPEGDRYRLEVSETSWPQEIAACMKKTPEFAEALKRGLLIIKKDTNHVA